MMETTETAQTQAIIWDPETIVRELNRVQEGCRKRPCAPLNSSGIGLCPPSSS